MKTKVYFLIAASTISGAAQAANDITVSIDSLTNVSGGGAMEACGSAKHSAGKKPLLVTIKHDESFYTTLTAPNGVWCSVIKRWTYNGSIDVGASTLDSPDSMQLRTIKANSKE